MSSSERTLYSICKGEGPILATAVHAGHGLREEVAALIALDEAARFREEDPYTDRWAEVAPTRIIPHFSRFEVDLNRARDQAVYVTPEDAWGLKLWKHMPPPELIERSLAQYDAFYKAFNGLLVELAERHGCFVVLDLHSYNHRRNGPHAPAEPPSANPEVNIGTGTMDRQRWARVVERFMADLRGFDFLGRRLDVRENIKFRGRNIPHWVHSRFPDAGCALAIEFKKFFMDEWTGEVDPPQMAAIQAALQATIPGLIEELRRI